MQVVSLLSGGQDSTTCLFWSIQKFGATEVVALTIDYGQRHNSEIGAAARIAEIAGVEWKLLSFPALQQIGDSPLVSSSGSIVGTHRGRSDLPASFVPGRNYLFLGLAAALAYKVGADSVVGGMCQTDYSGYPDCREVAIRHIEQAISTSMDFPLKIYTPLMYLTKADSVRMAQGLADCMDALAYSQTCYEGKYPPCEVCPACRLRAKGFMEAGIPDPLIVRSRMDLRKGGWHV